MRWPEVAIWGVLASLAGCVDPDLSGLERRLAAQASSTGSSQSVPSYVPVYPRFAYHHGDKRSPFLAKARDPQADIMDSQSERAEQQRSRVSLAAFKLEDLALVGTLAVGERYSALIRDPRGRVHLVQPGAYLGDSASEVVAIDATRMTIAEKRPDGQGGWARHISRLSLDDDTGNGTSE
ncbi:type IV pilus assembly protein PilP [Aidingimonas halophila]|uniref:Type IV pilus assembly protein PilP n=2 Tax=Aidingimonas halophila TaxID=574349 RepID=A0A1H2VEL1_9GAMM|nr:pilus assembly protein PilP [Aidingimonas halophila]GHC24148.1 hypothetical protein GCM10008094_13890 [Aidingimonas halophila]SDW66354.1 type IV pilus assembly protein PilP [Aidingimonas halophila]